ncbi:MAG: hypothetical protein ACRYG2_37290 [Janthinobacterium lividum]
MARKGQSPLSEIGRAFGISEGCLRNWLSKADVDDGRRPGLTSADSAELRELKRRNGFLEQEIEVLQGTADDTPHGVASSGSITPATSP